MSRRNYKLIVLGIILVAALLWLWLPKKSQLLPKAIASPTPTGTPTQVPTAKAVASSPTLTLNQLPSKALENMAEKEMEREKKIWGSILATPIQFYGKVVDEKGNPIPDARAHISFVDTAGSGSTHTKVNEKTDVDGLFHTEGHGLGVVVMVSKEGYYHLDQSDGNFQYSKAAGQVNPHPDPNNPAVFVLRRAGKPETLICVADKDTKIAKNGTPIELSLTTGKVVSGGNDNIKVEAWINDQGHQVNSNLPYDWHCQISIPGGGLVQREGDFNFEAPENGYQAADEIDMPATLGPKWHSQVSRNYFVKLGSGNYARLEFTMTAGGEHFFTITSYLNPSGSRNLESAPVQNNPH